VNTLRGPRKNVLDGGPDNPTARGREFDAAFAKLLWPLVVTIYAQNSQQVL